MYLNEYHLQFLETLCDTDSDFIVVGGQARSLHTDYKTRDLDIWIHVTGDAAIAALKALQIWRRKYPSHFHPAADLPNPLPTGMQIHIPDADVLYFDQYRASAPIAAKDGIDVLTSLWDWGFEDVRSRCEMVSERGLCLPVLSQADLELSDKFMAQQKEQGAL